MNKNKCEACKERKERIYICSPLRPKAQEPERAEIELKDNLERAKAACRLVAKLGAVPLCSHLFWMMRLQMRGRSEGASAWNC